MHVVSLTGATSVVDAEHGTIDADENGVFDVPEELGLRLVSFATEWRSKLDQEAHLVAEEAARLADPETAVTLLKELRDRIGDLEAEVARLAGKAPAKPEPKPKPAGKAPAKPEPTPTA